MGESFAEKRLRHQLKFDPRRSAVLVVDMLNDFLADGGVMVLPEGRALYDPINRLLEAARRAGSSVLWLCDEHPPGPDKEFEKRIPHCLRGTWGAEIVDDLKKRPDEFRIPKRRYSGFYGTDLDLRLRELGVDHVIVTGLATNICVRSTIHDAFFFGYDVIVPQECVAATSEREQASSLYDIDTHYGTVTSCEEVIAILQEPDAATITTSASTSSEKRK